MLYLQTCIILAPLQTSTLPCHEAENTIKPTIIHSPQPSKHPHLIKGTLCSARGVGQGKDDRTPLIYVPTLHHAFHTQARTPVLPSPIAVVTTADAATETQALACSARLRACTDHGLHHILQAGGRMEGEVSLSSDL